MSNVNVFKNDTDGSDVSLLYGNNELNECYANNFNENKSSRKSNSNPKLRNANSTNNGFDLINDTNYHIGFNTPMTRSLNLNLRRRQVHDHPLNSEVNHALKFKKMDSN
jgi:hypothetical protein